MDGETPEPAMRSRHARTLANGRVRAGRLVQQMTCAPIHSSASTAAWDQSKVDVPYAYSNQLPTLGRRLSIGMLHVRGSLLVASDCRACSKDGRWRFCAAMHHQGVLLLLWAGDSSTPSLAREFSHPIDVRRFAYMLYRGRHSSVRAPSLALTTYSLIAFDSVSKVGHRSMWRDELIPVLPWRIWSSWAPGNHYSMTSMKPNPLANVSGVEDVPHVDAGRPSLGGRIRRDAEHQGPSLGGHTISHPNCQHYDLPLAANESFVSSEIEHWHHCKGCMAPAYGWEIFQSHNAFVSRLFRSNGWDVLDTWEMDVLRPDAHTRFSNPPMRKPGSIQKQDCLHWSSPGLPMRGALC